MCPNDQVDNFDGAEACLHHSSSDATIKLSRLPLTDPTAIRLPPLTAGVAHDLVLGPRNFTRHQFTLMTNPRV